MKLPKEIYAYEKTADEYFANTKKIDGEALKNQEKFCKLILRNGKIIDLCCGPGRDAAALSRKGFSVTGIDAAPAMIKKARGVAPDATFHIMDVRKMNFPMNTFDAGYFNAGLLCLKKKEALAVVRKIGIILKKGGKLFISTKEGTGEGFKTDVRYGVEKYYSYYTQEELKTLLKKSGFKILHSEVSQDGRQGKHNKQAWIFMMCEKPLKSPPKYKKASKKTKIDREVKQ